MSKNIFFNIYFNLKYTDITYTLPSHGTFDHTTQLYLHRSEEFHNTFF